LTTYFTERESGPVPRSVDLVDTRVWGGIYSLIQVHVANGSFGFRFPEYCSDVGNENAACGCDWRAFGLVLAAEVPGSTWPLAADDLPETPVIMDLLEFCARAVGRPASVYYHSYMRHNHLRWERELGLAQFVADVNTLFVRNGLAFELDAEGQARRLLPQPVAEAIGRAWFRTGDSETDRLLETARKRILSPKPEDRQDAIEKLWDAFERLKTLEPGSDKKAQSSALLDRVAVPASPFRLLIETEAIALTKIGNDFQIRHWETNRAPIPGSHECDYLFMRMFAFLRLALAATGRGG